MLFRGGCQGSAARARDAVRAPIAVLVLALAAATFSLFPPASADGAPPRTVASLGAAAGQVNRPAGVAIDADGNAYVADEINRRVDKFDAQGHFVMAWGWGVADGAAELQTCTTTCLQGLSAANAGALNAPTSIALDPLTGDVYVVDRTNRRVVKYTSAGAFLLMFGKNVNTTPGTLTPNLCTAADLAAGGTCGAGQSGTGPGEFRTPQSIAVSEDGTEVWVGDENRLEEFTASGSFVAEIALPGGGRTNSLAIAPDGDFYAKSQSIPGIRRLEAGTGTQLEVLDAAGTAVTATVDPSGRVVVGDETAPYRFLVFDPAGAQVSQFGAGQVIGYPGGNGAGTPSGGSPLAATATRLWVTSSSSGAESAVQLFRLPEPGPLPEAPRATGVLPTSATLGALLNPEGRATTYFFEYGTDTSYGQSTSVRTLAGSGFEAEPAEVAVDALLPETEYHFRLVATNHCNAAEPAEECEVASEDATFTTPPAIGISGESVVAVTADSATVQVDLDPFGVPATWWVEYGTSEGYGLRTPATPVAGVNGAVAVTALLPGLAPGTAYHYRVVAEDEREGERYLVRGEDRSFTTRLSGGFGLIDGRAWELVSPPRKHGRIVAPYTGIVEAAEDGSALAYLSKLPISEDPLGNRTIELSQVLARHAAGGWASEDFVTPNDTAVPFLVGGGTEYKFYSPTLDRSLVEPRSGYPLSVESSERTPYLREGFAAETRWRPLVTGKEGYANVPPGTQFGGELRNKAEGLVRTEGASPDLSQVVVHSEVPLAAGAPDGALYEWSAGRLEAVSILPGGEGGAIAEGELGSGGPGGVNGVSGHLRTRAVSADGCYVVWTRPAVAPSPLALYLRDSCTDSTIKLDTVQPGASGSGAAAPFYVGASADGSRIFFTDTQALTEGSSSTGADLYECRIILQGGTPACDLRDLTPAPGAGESASVQGLLPGIGEDGGTVYVVANGVLTRGEGAEPGDCAGEPDPSATCSLYVLRWDTTSEAWRTRFVATVSNEDALLWGTWTIGAPRRVNPEYLAAAGSPSGRYLAFMSQRPLTPADTRDRATGEADEEVYLYDDVADELTCVSCDPTGSRPAGILDQATGSATGPWGVADPHGLWRGRRLAAAVPDALQERNNWSRYQPRFVLDDGRVFFNSADSLVPADTNGTIDPYQYEPSGVGGCSAGAIGAAVSATKGGCVGLLSSGASNEESALLDASASGDDVFLLTPGRLSTADTDPSYDVYDAHVCGSGWACPPAVPATPPCESAASCHPGAGGTSGVGEPGSSSFAGPGNLHGGARKCSAHARKARKLSHRAKRLRRDATKVARHDHRRAARMRHRARILARRAHRLRRQARRCAAPHHGTGRKSRAGQQKHVRSAHHRAGGEKGSRDGG